MNPAIEHKALLFDKDNELSGCKQVPDVVCPNCFHPMEFPNLYGPAAYDGHCLRTYLGWCFRCNKGFQAIQYHDAASGRWIIHKYQGYMLRNNVPVHDDQWIMLNRLPEMTPAEPPLVQTGPGGEYVKQITGEQLDIAIQQTALLLNKIGHLICELMKLKNHKTSNES